MGGCVGARPLPMFPMAGVILLLIVPLVSAQSGAGSGSSSICLNTTRCFLTLEQRSRTGCQGACASNGQEIVTVETEGVQYSLVTQSPTHSLWNSYKRSPQEWTWINTGSPVGTGRWLTVNTSSSRGVYEDCVSVLQSRGFQWQARPCGDSLGYICQTARNSSFCGRASADLIFEEVLVTDDTCLLLKRYSPTGWFKAKLECERFNTTLVELQDEDLYARLEHLTQYSNKSWQYWIGLTKAFWITDQGQPTWSNLWISNEPKGVGDCMRVAKVDGVSGWTDSNCQTEALCVCQTSQNQSSASGLSSTTFSSTITDKPTTITDRPITITDRPTTTTDRPTTIPDRASSTFNNVPVSPTTSPTLTTDLPNRTSSTTSSTTSSSSTQDTTAASTKSGPAAHVNTILLAVFVVIAVLILIMAICVVIICIKKRRAFRSKEGRGVHFTEMDDTEDSRSSYSHVSGHSGNNARRNITRSSGRKALTKTKRLINLQRMKKRRRIGPKEARKALKDPKTEPNTLYYNCWQLSANP